MKRSHESLRQVQGGNTIRKLAIVTTLAAGALSTACSAEKPHTTTPTTVPVNGSEASRGTVMTTISPEQQAKEEVNKARMDAAWQVVQDHAINSAVSTAYLMSSFDVGIQNYDDRTIGNKPAIVGKDLVMGTPDDSYYHGIPEMIARFNPVSHTIDVNAVHMDGSGDGALFDSIYTSFRVTADNPISTITARPLQPIDFREALTAPGTELISVQVQNGWGFSEAAGKSHGQEFGMSFENEQYYAGKDVTPLLESYKGDVQTDPARFESQGDALVTMLDSANQVFAHACSRGNYK